MEPRKAISLSLFGVLKIASGVPCSTIKPLSMKATLPPIVNEAITLVKDTALVSAIAVVDLMKATNSAVNRLTSLEPFFYAAIIYLLMTFVLTLIAGRLEKHFSRYDAKEEW